MEQNTLYSSLSKEDNSVQVVQIVREYKMIYNNDYTNVNPGIRLV